MQNQSKNISASIKNQIPSRNVTIHESWKNVRIISQKIYSLAQKKEWQLLINEIINQKKLIHRHLEKFPISPTTANFYKNKLSWLFKIESDINEISKTARAIAFRS